MKRRAFLATALALGSGGVVAEPTAVRRVGYLAGGRSTGKGLSARLAALGWIEGRNLHLVKRGFAQGGQAAADAGARELLAERPEVVVAFLRESVQAVVRADATVPIVAVLHDPVIEGFARSHGRPGGRVTGVALSSPEGVKLSFRLLGAVMPRLKRIHALSAGSFHTRPTVTAVRESIGRELGWEFVPHVIASQAQALAVVEAIRSRTEEAVAIADVPGLDYEGLGAALLRARVAAMDTTGHMERGSLLSAGMYHPDFWGRLAAIVDKVLRGGDPAEIPFEQPTHAEVVLDRRTAAAIGVTFPQEVLLRATKIIG